MEACFVNSNRCIYLDNRIKNPHSFAGNKS